MSYLEEHYKELRNTEEYRQRLSDSVNDLVERSKLSTVSDAKRLSRMVNLIVKGYSIEEAEVIAKRDERDEKIQKILS